MVQLVYCMKVAEPWAAKSLRDGTAWFSMIDRYIQIALQNHNDEQGDEYEGVFARQKKNSPYVTWCEKAFGDDLEPLKDPINADEYCLLRRKSSKNVCAFCMYGVTADDIHLLPGPDLENGRSVYKYEYYVSRDMFNGFLDKGLEVAAVSASVGHLYEAIEEGANSIGGQLYRREVVYDIDLTKEFFLEDVKPGGPYVELFHKRERFSRQHEIRTLISGIERDPSKSGIEVPYKKLDDESIRYDEDVKEGFKLVFMCSIKETTP